VDEEEVEAREDTTLTEVAVDGEHWSANILGLR
jgi:hypothetical protein